MPLSFAGFRLASTSTLRPCICSTGTNFTSPDTICSTKPTSHQAGNHLLHLHTTSCLYCLYLCLSASIQHMPKG